MRINKIYVISLGIEDDPKQQELIEQKLKDCDFFANTSYEVIKAFDGRSGDVAKGYNVYPNWQLNEDSEFAWNDWWQRPVLPGEVGCAISHRQAWERMMFDGMGLSLILEEDFLMGEGNSISKLPDPHSSTEWEVALLGRDIIEKDIEEDIIDENWVKPRHFYNMHAYIVKNSNVAKKLLSGGLRENVIPVDEYLSALGHTHRREDIANLFPQSFNLIATRDPDFIGQSRGWKESTIEPHEGSPNQTYHEHNEGTPTTDVAAAIEDPQPNSYFEVLDDSDWEAWKLKYLTLSVAKGEWDLMIDDLGDNLYEFPLFTPKFCKEVIAMAEAKNNWTIDRHEFYPTNDVLLQDIGLDAIYDRVLDEVVRPLVIHIWHLEGATWEGFSNENFMARYTTERQSHLSLHHDRSHLTLVVKLNDEFSGGGTWFPKYQKLVNPTNVGTASIHPGMLTHRHGARPITMGKRYVMISFIRSHEEP